MGGGGGGGGRGGGTRVLRALSVRSLATRRGVGIFPAGAAADGQSLIFVLSMVAMKYIFYRIDRTAQRHEPGGDGIYLRNQGPSRKLGGLACHEKTKKKMSDRNPRLVWPRFSAHNGYSGPSSSLSHPPFFFLSRIFMKNVRVIFFTRGQCPTT